MTASDCKDLIAIVTGGNKGIGAAIARELSKRGAAVVSFGRSVEHGEAVVKEIRGQGGTAEHRKVDVADEQQIDQAVAYVQDKFGRIDIVVNNAMAVDVIHAGNEVPFGDQTSETFDYMLKVGLYAPFWIANRVLGGMVKRRSGSFINISSVSSRIAIPNMPSYSVAKAALEALTRGIAADYGQYGVRANTILVGAVETDDKVELYRTPGVAEALRTTRLIDRMGLPEDVARMAGFLASPLNDYLTAGVYPVDGGQSVTQHVPLGAMRPDDVVGG